ncbi:MAG: hypothetical protein NTY73_01195 [Candidatus Micrarchaeota archaeon]|nr:hypothetical protein [Candidatus Micrarchaeota archaeon]
MSECINHPGKEGMYKCARCKRHFCLVCVELIGEKAYCFDCLKEIVKESREGKVKSLTMKVMVSSIVSLMIAVVSLYNALPLLRLIYKNLMGSYEPLSIITPNDTLYFATGLAFLALSVGLATTKRWAYKYGIVVSAVAFVIGIVNAMSFPGGIEGILSTPQSNATALFIIMAVGPLILLVSILGSRKELLGW